MGSGDDQFWAKYLGVDPSDWASEGISVRAHVGLVGYGGLWCFRRRDRIVVSVPAGWATTLKESLENCEPDALFEETLLKEVLGSDFERLIGPVFQGCLDIGRFRPAPFTNARLVVPSDAAEVQQFRSECGAEAWEVGGLDEVKGHMAAYVDGHKIRAMAGYRPWNDLAGDPCVLTHPEFRRRGYGAGVVSSVVAAALDEGKTLLYQTLEANRGAVQMALNLGYEQYASHVAVRLKRESPSNSELQRPGCARR
jgi:GNAT superfamily N-acetyltransferase